MLIRSNPRGIYPARFSWSSRGLLLITRRAIIATGTLALAWRN